MTGLVIYPLITAAMFYLGSRAKITEFAWSRYPASVTSFMDCAACTGFWYGLLVSLVLQVEVGTLPVKEWYAPLVIGLCSMVWTPIVAYLMDTSLYRLGSVAPSASFSDNPNDAEN